MLRPRLPIQLLNGEELPPFCLCDGCICMHTQRDVCLAMISISSKTSLWVTGEKLRGVTGLIFIIPSQLHSYPLIFNFLRS